MISPNFKLILHVLHMGPCPPAVGVHKMYCHPLHGLLLLLVSHGISQHQNILEVIWTHLGFNTQNCGKRSGCLMALKNATAL